jgi:hypothetical protein
MSTAPPLRARHSNGGGGVLHAPQVLQCMLSGECMNTCIKRPGLGGGHAMVCLTAPLLALHLASR